jgi:L-lactate dehydrogenase
LDTARLKTRLSEIFKVSPKQVHANVLGEHGDTSFVAWSLARIAGVNIDEYTSAYTEAKDVEGIELNKEEVTEYVKKSGGVIISRKGATYNGVAAAVVYICKALFTGIDSILCLSVLMKGEYGIEDVCVSIPTVLGSNGIVSTLTPKLSDDELEKLKISAQAMKDVINQVKV